MLGVITGDMCGSVYEFHNYKTTDLSEIHLRRDCFFTDDSVLTVAVADGLLHGCSDSTDFLREWGRRLSTRWLYGKQEPPA